MASQTSCVTLRDSVALASFANDGLLGTLRAMPKKQKSLRDLIEEVESVKTTLQRLGKTVETSDDTIFLKLNDPLQSFRKTCDWLSRVASNIVDAKDFGQGLSFQHWTNGQQSHMHNLRRILSCYKSVFEATASFQKW